MGWGREVGVAEKKDTINVKTGRQTSQKNS